MFDTSLVLPRHTDEGSVYFLVLTGYIVSSIPIYTCIDNVNTKTNNTIDNPKPIYLQIKDNLLILINKRY
jgi:hypothetical protein